MKRILSLALALALTAALFTGCGCAANVSDHPGGMITDSTTEPSIMPHPTATHATDPRDTEATTRPSATDDTGMTGENSTPTGTTDATVDPRTRGRARDAVK